ncbi:hypothetical protein [Peribacillus simplex]|uniref:hypothetical protein n=1 Tax=Peribacillus simplex TaxID=1478 RepID=UPI001484DBC9|nr:hypothetical protein [Peribacillus simplex]
MLGKMMAMPVCLLLIEAFGALFEEDSYEMIGMPSLEKQSIALLISVALGCARGFN